MKKFSILKEEYDSRFKIKECNQSEIDKVEKLLISKLHENFGNVGYTIKIIKWNDGTFMVELNHGEKLIGNVGKLNTWRWYDNEITYSYTFVEKI